MSLATRVMSTLIVAVLLLGPSDARAQALTLEIENGLVTLNAQGVSVRQILERWATIGSVTIINGDEVGATPVTLQLSGVPERAALETLLRDVRGYILRRRQPDVGAITAFDRIMILPTSVASRVASATAATPLPSLDSADEASALGAVIVAALDVSAAARSAPSAEATGSAEGSFGTTPSPRLPEQARPEPIRYLDELDENGDRMRAPTIAKYDPADQSASDAPGQSSKQAVPPTHLVSPLGLRGPALYRRCRHERSPDDLAGNH